MIPGFARWRDANLRLMIIELAIASHEEMHGWPPDRLGQLVPKYLDTIPQDPYSNLPAIYTKQDQGFLLYFAGPDGDDDGGKFISEIEIKDGKDGDFLPESPLDPAPASAIDP